MRTQGLGGQGECGISFASCVVVGGRREGQSAPPVAHLPKYRWGQAGAYWPTVAEIPLSRRGDLRRCSEVQFSRASHNSTEIPERDEQGRRVAHLLGAGFCNFFCGSTLMGAVSRRGHAVGRGRRMHCRCVSGGQLVSNSCGHLARTVGAVGLIGSAEHRHT